MLLQCIGIIKIGFTTWRCAANKFLIVNRVGKKLVHRVKRHVVNNKICRQYFVEPVAERGKKFLVANITSPPCWIEKIPLPVKLCGCPCMRERGYLSFFFCIAPYYMRINANTFA